MVTAAYVKNLLCRIVPQQVEREANIVNHNHISFLGHNFGLQIGMNHEHINSGK
jgi:hypothetical protein